MFPVQECFNLTHPHINTGLQFRARCIYVSSHPNAQSALIFLGHSARPGAAVVALLTLLALHGSVVARFPESDVPQVQDSGHDLQHHGAAIRRYANHTHGVLGKQRRKAGRELRSGNGLRTPSPFTTGNNLCCGLAVKAKQLGEANKRGENRRREVG